MDWDTARPFTAHHQRQPSATTRPLGRAGSGRGVWRGGAYLVDALRVERRVRDLQQVMLLVLLVAFRTPLSPFASFGNYSFLFHIRFFDCLRRLHSKSLGQYL